MDSAKPIMNMVVNAVANDMGFIQFMSFTVLIIMKPTITSVPTVHADVTIEKTGVKNKCELKMPESFIDIKDHELEQTAGNLFLKYTPSMT